MDTDNKPSYFRMTSGGFSQESSLRSLLFLIYVSDILKAFILTLLFYADNLCLVGQHTDAKKRLSKDFEKIRNWSVDDQIFVFL